MQTFAVHSLFETHRRHFRPADTLERLNQETKRRTRIIHVFPHADSGLRFVRALAARIHEDWQEGQRCLKIDILNAHQRESQKKTTAAFPGSG